MEMGRGRAGEVCLPAVVRNSNCSPPCLRTGQKVISPLNKGAIEGLFRAKYHGDSKALALHRLVI